LTFDPWTPPESGPLSRFSTTILRLTLLYCAAIFVLSVREHSRWTHLSTMAIAYLLPIAGALAITLILRASTTARVVAVLVIIPFVAAVFATDIFFAIPGRTIRKWGMHFIADRQRNVVAGELRNKGINAYPYVTSAEFRYGRDMRWIGADSILPLASVSNKVTVMCAEGDLAVTFNSDEHGFNNPPGLWKPDSVDLALIGDSFVFGSCVPPRDHFVSSVRSLIPRTLNLGGLGNGPLSELGLLREFAAPMRPPRVLWFFFEGNDMEELETEKVYFLRNYLDSTFSQHLLEKQGVTDRTLTAYGDSAVAIGRGNKPPATQFRDLMMLRDLRIALGLEAASAERVITPDYATFSRVLAEAKRTVDGWGGSLTLVYLPEQNRTEPDARQPMGRQHDEEDIRSHTLAIAQKLGIPVLDMAVRFSQDSDRKALWWRPRTHLSPYGNQRLGAAVLELLR
jgi:hypothetical protein